MGRGLSHGVGPVTWGHGLSHGVGPTAYEEFHDCILHSGLEFGLLICKNCQGCKVSCDSWEETTR